MITPKELNEKANRMFVKTVQAILRNENLFPLMIPANKTVTATGFSDLKAAILPIYQHSKEVKGKGYSVEWKSKLIDGTKQKLPAKIYFETVEDYLYYTRRESDYLLVQNNLTLIKVTFPQLYQWAIENINFILNNAVVFADLMKVCEYFTKNPPPHHLYLRELPIAVHSKFIEDNTGALKKLLDELLPANWINKKEPDFSERYFIKKANVYTQIRVLDENLKSTLGFHELALTLEDSASLTWNPGKVFIIENKACFLSFPRIDNAVAIFGEGFKSRVNKEIPWLTKAEVYCWFDLDAAGFEMLNMIRQHYPSAKSFLMDPATLDEFREFEVENKYKVRQLPQLTTDENLLYQYLVENNIRLEQERITQQHVRLSLFKSQIISSLP
jgi:hypothetical protein